MDELRFDDKSVIVTGGGRGFGRQHALLLASRGARVVVADFGVNMDGTGSSPEPAEQVANEIEAAGGEAVACFANVAQEAGAAEVVQTAVKAFGGVDIVVNNAGIWDGNWIDQLSNEQFRRMLDYHYLGTVYVTTAAWPLLKSAPKAAIVNTTSEAVIGHIPKNPDYAGAKGAVLSFTKSLALNGRLFDIRVNAIAPRGSTRMSSPQVLAHTFDRKEGDYNLDESLRPENASPAVAFLAHESCPLNGEVIVCGGLVAMRLAIIETKGVTFHEKITPEDLADNLDSLMHPTDAQVMGVDVWG
jgi:hypothetical protein